MVDADRKVYLSKFLKGVRALRRFSHSEGKMVDLRDLDSVLAEMGMHLTQEELQEVLKHVRVDGDGKVNVSDFTKNVISTQRTSQAEREGKVNLSDFMKSVQRLSEAGGEKVDVEKLDAILASMGIHITEEEFQKALGGVTHDEGPEESAGEASVVPESPPGPLLQGSPSAEERPAPRRARRRTPRLLPPAATDPQLLAILRRQLEVSEQHLRLQEQALAWRKEAWGAYMQTINRLVDYLAPHAAPAEPPPAMPAPAAPPPAAPAVAGPSAVAPPPPREGHRAEGPLEPPETRRRHYLPVQPAPTQPRTRLQARRSSQPGTPSAGL
ncbi:uncharacterized protein LOC142002861 [Carettochelys insculpta]|uniref:uncharacterized protein LOC142002861 n=1 Tax=Carettochelys insculpta TaxID=44489 RepID=UPI003EB94FDC